MHSIIKLLLLLLATPILIFGIHILLSRFLKKSPPQIVAIFSIILAQFIFLFLLWWFIFRIGELTKTEMISSLFYSFIALCSSGYIYFHVFNTSETARRIRILHEISDFGSLSCPEIRELYDHDDIIDVRLKRLLDLKQLTTDGKHYYLSGHVLYWAARAISIWRNILGMKTHY